MRIVLAGATGFVGTYLVRALCDRGDSPTLLVRASTDRSRIDARAKTIAWSASSPSDEAREAIANADGVVNLAGAGVLDSRWSEERMRLIRDSRIETTRALASSIDGAAERERVFVSASAVGYYGMRKDDAELDESSPPGDDLLARVCVDWENAARVSSGTCRVALPRIGIVLGDGGALARMLPAFRAFAGGPIGSGTQWWSWIHCDDVVRALLFALDTKAIEGAFNVTAKTATMNDVARTLGKVMHRPHAMRVPAFALRLMLGDGADVLLTGQRVLPKKLEAAGFTFRFADLEGALIDVLK